MTTKKLLGIAVDVLFVAVGVVAAIMLVGERFGHLHEGPEPLTILPSRTFGISDLPILGSPDAPAVIIEFSDFECPYCRRHALDTFPALKRELVDAGLVRYAFAANPLESIHSRARQLAAVAFCGTDYGRFWDIHESFFRSPPQSDAHLSDAVEALGLAPSPLLACASEGGRGWQAVDLQSRLADDWQLTGTPSFLVGRPLGGDRVAVTVAVVGSQPAPVFRQALSAVTTGRLP